MLNKTDIRFSHWLKWLKTTCSTPFLGRQRIEETDHCTSYPKKLQRMGQSRNECRQWPRMAQRLCYLIHLTRHDPANLVEICLRLKLMFPFLMNGKEKPKGSQGHFFCWWLLPRYQPRWSWNCLVQAKWAEALRPAWWSSTWHNWISLEACTPDIALSDMQRSGRIYTINNIYIYIYDVYIYIYINTWDSLLPTSLVLFVSGPRSESLSWILLDPLGSIRSIRSIRHGQFCPHINNS